MNENYLHFLWKTKRLPFHLLKTTSNEVISIKHVGYHNLNESGPDFFNGRILLGGIEWCGNIELHVKSSDWYQHKHQNDLAYDNVVLHVVYENDLDVFIRDVKVPTIELKEYIDWNHYDAFQNFNMNFGSINCSKSVSNIDRVYIESMMERSVVDRLNRKIFFLKQDINSIEPRDVLYFLLARAFGAKVNQFPFEELTHRLPLSILKTLKRNKQFNLIILTSGIYQDESDCSIDFKMNNFNKVGGHSWKRKGLRPQSFPEIRIKQFALFVSQFDFNLVHFMKSSSDLKSLFNSMFEMISKSGEAKLKFSTQFINLLIINCVVPFLWWLGDILEDAGLKEKAIEMLQITTPEKNGILNTWKSFSIKANSAYESQALIELYNEYCAKNKCLSCEIGVQILTN